jgi:hypothetical protein
MSLDHPVRAQSPQVERTENHDCYKSFSDMNRAVINLDQGKSSSLLERLPRLGD